MVPSFPAFLSPAARDSMTLFAQDGTKSSPSTFESEHSDRRREECLARISVSLFIHVKKRNYVLEAFLFFPFDSREALSSPLFLHLKACSNISRIFSYPTSHEIEREAEWRCRGGHFSVASRRVS